MSFYKLVSVTTWIVAGGGLAVAYLSAIAGVLGFLDGKSVTIAMLGSMAVAFMATVGYFVSSSYRLGRQFKQAEAHH